MASAKLLFIKEGAKINAGPLYMVGLTAAVKFYINPLAKSADYVMGNVCKIANQNACKNQKGKCVRKVAYITGKSHVAADRKTHGNKTKAARIKKIFVSVILIPPFLLYCTQILAPANRSFGEILGGGGRKWRSCRRNIYDLISFFHESK